MAVKYQAQPSGDHPQRRRNPKKAVADERLEDIPLLCEDFLRRMGYPTEHCVIDAGLPEALQNWRPWQGNGRELRNSVEHASVIARGRRLSIRDFPEPQRDLQSSAADTNLERLSQAIQRWTNAELQAGDESATNLHRLFLQAVEPAFLQAVLRYADGNRAAAAPCANHSVTSISGDAHPLGSPRSFSTALALVRSHSFLFRVAKTSPAVVINPSPFAPCRGSVCGRRHDFLTNPSRLGTARTVAPQLRTRRIVAHVSVIKQGVFACSVFSFLL